MSLSSGQCSVSKWAPNLRSPKSGCPESSIGAAASPSLPGHLSTSRNWERTASNLLPGIGEGWVFSIREFSLPSKQIFQQSSAICKQALFNPSHQPVPSKATHRRIALLEPIRRSSSAENEARHHSGVSWWRWGQPQLNCNFRTQVSTFSVAKCGSVNHKCIRIVLVCHGL